MPAGKIAVSGGVGYWQYLPYGVSIRSMLRYAKPRVKPLDCQEIQDRRRYLRDTFKTYIFDCSNAAPTATERRRSLVRIKNSAALLLSIPSTQNHYAFLSALETRDSDALSMAYRALTAECHSPQRLKRRLRHWTVNSPRDESIISAARALASLDVEALVPVSGRFQDPGLAHLVAALIPIWKSVTGRTAGLVQANARGHKKCPFADWLGEMHELMGLAAPSLWSVVAIVKWFERSENPAPFQS
jgi:hypothetical protein